MNGFHYQQIITQNKYVLHAQRSVSMSEDNSQPFRSYNRTWEEIESYA